MGCVRDTKGHEQVFDFVSIVHANAIGNAFDPHVGWILEKGDRWKDMTDHCQPMISSPLDPYYDLSVHIMGHMNTTFLVTTYRNLLFYQYPLQLLHKSSC